MGAVHWELPGVGPDWVEGVDIVSHLSQGAVMGVASHTSVWWGGPAE